MPFSNMNKKLKQRMTGIEKSRRKYQDCLEWGHRLNDRIIFQKALISQAPSRQARSQYAQPEL